MDFDLEEAAGVARSPPIPMDSIRRVASLVLKPISEMRKVEDFLGRVGQSMYDGRTSFFDILMSVFPRNKKLSLSRAGFANDAEAQLVAILLSWAATCERWCSEYEELRRLQSSVDRKSKYAETRSLVFRTAANTAIAADNFAPVPGSTQWMAGANTGTVIEEMHDLKIPQEDALVALTYQVLLMRPLVWHRELDPLASFADPVALTPGATLKSTPFNTPWHLALRYLVAKATAYTADQTGITTQAVVYGSLYTQVVYVDGAAMLVSAVFTTAIKQLMDESAAMFPSDKPRARRGVCPAGTEFVVTFGSATVMDKQLDAALRAAVRKYGAIRDVAIVCKQPEFKFTAVPLDESALW